VTRADLDTTVRSNYVNANPSDLHIFYGGLALMLAEEHAPKLRATPYARRDDLATINAPATAHCEVEDIIASQGTVQAWRSCPADKLDVLRSAMPKVKHQIERVIARINSTPGRAFAGTRSNYILKELVIDKDLNLVSSRSFGMHHDHKDRTDDHFYILGRVAHTVSMPQMMNDVQILDLFLWPYLKRLIALGALEDTDAGITGAKTRFWLCAYLEQCEYYWYFLRQAMRAEDDTTRQGQFEQAAIFLDVTERWRKWVYKALESHPQ
jgi:hypothetical protein